MHVVRLLTMAKEIANGEGLILDRSSIDRDFLLGIKNHSMSYEDIMKYCTELQKEMLDTFKASKLPESPNRQELEMILIRIRKSRFGII